MSTKALVWIGLFIGSIVGGWIGALAAGGNWLSWQSILGDTIGAFVGIYAGFKIGQYL